MQDMGTTVRPTAAEASTLSIEAWACQILSGDVANIPQKVAKEN